MHASPRGWIRPREGEGPLCYDDGASPTKKPKVKRVGLGSELEGDGSSSAPNDEGLRSLGDRSRENSAEKEGGNGEGVPSDTQGIPVDQATVLACEASLLLYANTTASVRANLTIDDETDNTHVNGG